MESIPAEIMKIGNSFGIESFFFEKKFVIKIKVLKTDMPAFLKFNNDDDVVLFKMISIPLQ